MVMDKSMEPEVNQWVSEGAKVQSMCVKRGKCL